MCWIKVLLDSSHANASMEDIQVIPLSDYALTNQDYYENLDISVCTKI